VRRLSLRLLLAATISSLLPLIIRARRHEFILQVDSIFPVAAEVNQR